MHQVRQIHQPPIFGMTTFQGLTATQWRNRINEYNPGMYSKEFLKNKTAKELAQIQNGKSYGVSESKSAAWIATPPPSSFCPGEGLSCGLRYLRIIFVRWEPLEVYYLRIIFGQSRALGALGLGVPASSQRATSGG